MKKVLVILLTIMFALNVSSFVSAQERQTQPCINASIIELKYDMQQRWIEHAWWTRSLIVSKIANLDDQELVLERLLRNQEDIGNLIKPYYGDEAGNKLTQLLKEHIEIAGRLVDVAKKGDQTVINSISMEWYKNADTIVDFLANANPNWDKKALTDMFYTHLKITTDEVTDRLKKDFKGDIAAADKNVEHLIGMGDFLTDGIVKQFPDKFNLNPSN